MAPPAGVMGTASTNVLVYWYTGTHTGMAPPAGVMGTAPLSYEYKRTRFTGTQVHILTAVGRQRGHA